jgi:hypothetical protein
LYVQGSWFGCSLQLGMQLNLPALYRPLSLSSDNGRAPGQMLDTLLPIPNAEYPAFYLIGIKASCAGALLASSEIAIPHYGRGSCAAACKRSLGSSLSSYGVEKPAKLLSVCQYVLRWKLGVPSRYLAQDLLDVGSIVDFIQDMHGIPVQEVDLGDDHHLGHRDAGMESPAKQTRSLSWHQRFSSFTVSLNSMKLNSLDSES